MDESEIKKLTGLYVSTAREYIEHLKKNIAILKENKKDKDAIANSYISSHSIKSQSLVMQFSGIGHASGILEFIFRDIKDDKKELDTQLLSLIEHAVLTVSFALQAISDSGEEPDLSTLIHELESGTGVHFTVK